MVQQCYTWRGASGATGGRIFTLFHHLRLSDDVKRRVIGRDLLAVFGEVVSQCWSGNGGGVGLLGGAKQESGGG